MEKTYEEGKIKLRIYKALSALEGKLIASSVKGQFRQNTGNHLTVRALKLYADGSLGSRSGCTTPALFG